MVKWIIFLLKNYVCEPYWLQNTVKNAKSINTSNEICIKCWNTHEYITIKFERCVWKFFIKNTKNVIKMNHNRDIIMVSSVVII